MKYFYLILQGKAYFATLICQMWLLKNSQENILLIVFYKMAYSD